MAHQDWAVVANRASAEHRVWAAGEQADLDLAQHQVLAAAVAADHQALGNRRVAKPLPAGFSPHHR